MRTQKPPRIPLPKGWPSHVKSGICRITRQLLKTIGQETLYLGLSELE